MRFVRAILRYSASSTYAIKSDGPGSSRCVAKLWVRYSPAPPARARVQRRVGLPPTRRNRFGGLPRDLARQSFPVVNVSVLGPEALDRVSTCIEVAYLAPIGAAAFCRGRDSPAGSYRAFGTKKRATSKNASVPGMYRSSPRSRLRLECSPPRLRCSIHITVLAKPIQGRASDAVRSKAEPWTSNSGSRPRIMRICANKSLNNMLRCRMHKLCLSLILLASIRVIRGQTLI
jgi:hypothetical protein